MLVSRFRSSHHCAASSFTNFGFGALACAFCARWEAVGMEMGTPISTSPETIKRDMGSTAAATPFAMAVDAAGVRPLASDADGRDVAATFCWVDVFGGEEGERKKLLAQLGLEDADLAAVLRLG